LIQKQYVCRIHLQENIMAVATYMPEALKHTTFTSSGQLPTICGHSVAVESFLAVTLGNSLGQLVMQLSSKLQILFPVGVRGRGSLCFSNTARKLSKHLRTALYWAVTQRVVVIPYRRFGTTYRSHLQGSRIKERAKLL
jgi:hypothetical protein